MPSTFIAMRWLMIGLLASLAALLLAAAGVARHIFVQRGKLRRQTATGERKTLPLTPGQIIDPAEDMEHDLEP
ncbi:MAG: hypothetical protein ABSF28_05970 [Terracidiphilus sp.]|jgi:ferric-dicitrate binding protein FerR (iron transport regulator)